MRTHLTDEQVLARMPRRARRLFADLRALVMQLRPPPGCTRFPFPLRRGLTVHLEVPTDLTVAEAARLREWIRWMPVDADPAQPEPPEDHPGPAGDTIPNTGETTT